MADVQIFGVNAGMHHLVNVLIHALTSVILFLVLLTMTEAIWKSAMVASIFAIHPIHVESVVWLAERKDVLCGLFFVLTLGAYVWYVRSAFRWGRYLAVFFLFAFALMSKPMGVTLPCVLLLLDYWPLNRVGNVTSARLLLEKAPFFAIALAAAWVTTLGHGGVNYGAMEGLTLPWRLGNAVVAYAIYLRQLVWPSRLAVFYPHPGQSLSIWIVCESLACLICITFVVIWQWRKRYLTVGWLWFLGMLLPVIGIIQSGDQAHADRYTYLPMIGAFITLVWWFGDWAHGRNRFIILSIVGLLCLGLLSFTAHRQTSYWRDNFTLWSHAIDSTRENALAEGNLGEAYLDTGNKEEAYRHLREQLRIDPENAGAHENLGTLFFRSGAIDEALQEYQEAIRLMPDELTFRMNLCNALYRKGRFARAVGEVLTVLQTHPENAEAHALLGSLYLRTGDTVRGFAECRQGLALNYNTANAHNDFGNLLHEYGMDTEAMEEYQKAINIDPSNFDGRMNIANLLRKLGDTSSALREYREVLRNHPDSVEVMTNLGNLLHEEGLSSEAIELLQRAYLIRPDALPVRLGMTWILSTAEDPKVRNGGKAIDLIEKEDATSHGKESVIMRRVLAAAHAEAGHFAQAIGLIRQAIDQANKTNQRDIMSQLQLELKSYEKKKAWRVEKNN